MAPRRFLGLAELLADETHGDNRRGAAFSGVKLPPLAWAFRAWPKVPMPEYPQDRKTLAHHEAGHCVFHHLLNLRMTGAVIHQAPLENGERGRVNMDLAGIVARASEIKEEDIPRAPYQLAAMQIACMFAAGAQAELELLGLRADGWLDLDDQDYRNIRAVLRDAFESDLPLFWCQRAARAVLIRHWPRVTAIAADLEIHGRIDIERVGQIFTQTKLNELQGAVG